MKRALLLLLAAASLEARSLKWDELAVRARLDELGNLHIREQQTMVFDGDWNGGERIFRLEPDQTLEIHRMSRVDENGQLVEMPRGSISELHGYELVDATTLRWRSRMPDDPPFQNRRITYVLEYTLGNVLVKRGDTYLLDHDFAFSDREGVIERFTLDIDLGESWKAPALVRTMSAGPLAPGTSFVVRETLEYTGSAAPGARRSTLALRSAIAFLFILAPFLLWRRMRRHEELVGRLTPLSSIAISRDRVDDALAGIPAEVVGTAWDEDVTASEVSALLARWAAEKKITTSAQSDELSMTLTAPRDSFEGYERELIDKLFFDGNHTSTAAIRQHYASKGFNPASLIARPLTAKAEALSHLNDPIALPSAAPSFILLLAAVVFFVFEFTVHEPAGSSIATIGVIVVFGLIGAGIAKQWRGRIDQGMRQTRSVRFCIAIVSLAAITPLFVGASWATRLGALCGGLLFVRFIINTARSKRGPAAIAFRKKLAAVRQYFIDELHKPEPAMEDRWFPYVIAFGLDDDANRWMQTFGGSSATTAAPFSSSSTSSRGGSSSGWSGGGGAFGGAGASGGWSAAAAGIAAGVAAPSSSSGGSSGGGSSSGGGGGGGW